MIAYDTIVCSYADSAIIRAENIASRLWEPRFLTNEVGEVTSIIGHLKNMRVTVTQAGVRLLGSLSKYIKGTNLSDISLEEVREASSEISDVLEIPAEKMKLFRLDVAANIKLENNVPSYFPFLGDSSRLERCSWAGSTLYYSSKKVAKTKPKQLVFYDKVAEQKANGETVPDVPNLLRYELRLNGRLPQQIGVPEVTLATLCKPDFFGKVCDIWLNEFQMINKVGEYQAPAGKLTDAAIEKELNAFAISQLTAEQIEVFFAAVNFQRRASKSQLLKKVREVRGKNAGITFQVMELENKILEQRSLSP